jgi:hypothetical protein
MKFSKTELLSRRREPSRNHSAPEEGSTAEIDGAHHKTAQQHAAQTMREFVDQHRNGMLEAVRKSRTINEQQARALEER